ncbi:hypothetical protein [Mesorhizobium sp. M7D.F.Ca.US.004.01.2.1]|uniref:hypothetical protein n=1 Tax=Mesorhizobium sp. M7D.F.Ca.US.004.01.2.1 TaxID=2496738 RepID=UPI0013DFB663|nr:hypothetical protein [Mesorhizobium sp. M7D.F.Ca.US.004.01.2.1]
MAVVAEKAMAVVVPAARVPVAIPVPGVAMTAVTMTVAILGPGVVAMMGQVTITAQTTAVTTDTSM